MSGDLQLRLAEHLWTVHNWRLTAMQVDSAEHLAEVTNPLRGNHALEHRSGVGSKWPGWPEHGHAPDLEATAR